MKGLFCLLILQLVGILPGYLPIGVLTIGIIIPTVYLAFCGRSKVAIVRFIAKLTLNDEKKIYTPAIQRCSFAPAHFHSIGCLLFWLSEKSAY